MKNLIRQFLLLLAMSIAAAGCTYEVSVGPPEITDQVSFSGDIIPIFNQSCNNAGCHNTGGIKPDLSRENAYQALNSGNYITTATPERSELYLWMNGERSIPMPLSGPNATYNAKVLAWIRQGAQNN